MRTFRPSIVLVSLLFVIGASGDNEPRKIAVLDDCDPTDTHWTDIGGCVLPDGEVSREEFEALVLPYGHPAWRNEPSALHIKADKHIDVANLGGRRHTFTKVQNFGRGIVPPLNNPPGPTPPAVPECLDANTVAASNLPPGAELRVEGLAPGTHRFQCCIHPWMRAEVTVK